MTGLRLGLGGLGTKGLGLGLDKYRLYCLEFDFMDDFYGYSQRHHKRDVKEDIKEDFKEDFKKDFERAFMGDFK